MQMKISILMSCAGLLLGEGAHASRANVDPPKIVRLVATQGTGTLACPSLPHVRGLQDLNCSEATALISQLKDVQRSLKAGGRLTFHLLSGAPASNPMTKISPREAFLRMPFEKAFIVHRVKTDNRLWRPYKIAIKPVGTGRFIWRVEVVRGFSDNLERVEMFYGPPPPA